MSDTPRMVSARRCQYENPNLPKYIVPYEDAAQVEYELTQCKCELVEAREEISDLQGDVEAWKRETMIANARLRGEKHPDDNGAISPKEIIPKLQRELAEEREHLAEAKREAEYLAAIIHRSEYADVAPDWSLCDSVAGVISQIDNMYAGVRQQRDEARQQRDTLAEALEQFVNVCDHAPPVDIIKHIGESCASARKALVAVKGGLRES